MLTTKRKMYKMTMKMQSAMEEVTYGKDKECQRGSSKNENHVETGI